MTPFYSRYHLIYESYTDHTQFEGSWDWRHDTFTSLAKARAERKGMMGSPDYRNVSPVLRPVSRRP